METVGFTLNELKRQDPEKYFQEVLYISEFNELKTLVEDSNNEISWEKLAEEGIVKIEGKRIEGIYWGRDLDLIRTKIRSLGKIKNIKGSLYCEMVQTLESLGDLEEIQGHLDIRGTSLKSLGKLQEVGYDLEAAGLKSLESLGELREVGGKGACRGYLEIRGTKVKSLGKLKEVRGILYCGGLKSLEDLGELELVRESMYISGTKIKSLGKLKKIGGFLDCKELETLESIGELEYVGKYLNLKNTKLKSLGKLKKVGGYLNCEGINVLNGVGDLEFIGGDLNIIGISAKMYVRFFRKIVNEKLKVKWQVKSHFLSELYENDLSELYKEEKLDFDFFQEKFGNDINYIENLNIKEELKILLIGEYELLEEEILLKIEQLKEENQGKDLEDEVKKDLRNQVLELGRSLKIQKEKIGSFGIKL